MSVRGSSVETRQIRTVKLGSLEPLVDRDRSHCDCYVGAPIRVRIPSNYMPLMLF